MKFEKTLGETLRKLREKENLTLREVANELNIDTSLLSKIEKNNRKPTKELLDKFSVYFNVDIKDLKITFLSDSVAYQIMDEEDYAKKILQAAEKKVKFFTSKKVTEK